MTTAPTYSGVFDAFSYHWTLNPFARMGSKFFDVVILLTLAF